MRPRDWWIATGVCVVWAAAVIGTLLGTTAHLLHTIQHHIEDED